MEPLLLLRPPPFFATTHRPPAHQIISGRNPRFRIRCSPVGSLEVEDPKSEYKMGLLDNLLMEFFRKKMVEEVGMNSDKHGYDGLMEVVNRLMTKGNGNLDAQQSAVRVLISLFPPWLLYLYKKLIAPIGGGKAASMMLARATALSCQWLMGPCSVNDIDLPDGSSCSSGVFVEKCKYLEESKCVGICINTCKIPTQTFFKDFMGVPLYMEPNFEDYSCQGQSPSRTLLGDMPKCQPTQGA